MQLFMVRLLVIITIVTVSGNDLSPDIAIGRISCETMEEANLLVDKIINLSG